MNSSDIDLFKTLYEEKNITHTAKRLFISQPALSHRLRNLEKEFDCTLVLRQPRALPSPRKASGSTPTASSRKRTTRPSGRSFPPSSPGRQAPYPSPAPTYSANTICPSC